jgi:hypothetical protein
MAALTRMSMEVHLLNQIERHAWQDGTCVNIVKEKSQVEEDRVRVTEVLHHNVDGSLAKFQKVFGDTVFKRQKSDGWQIVVPNRLVTIHRKKLATEKLDKKVAENFACVIEYLTDEVNLKKERPNEDVQKVKPGTIYQSDAHYVLEMERRPPPHGRQLGNRLYASPQFEELLQRAKEWKKSQESGDRKDEAKAKA